MMTCSDAYQLGHLTGVYFTYQKIINDDVNGNGKWCQCWDTKTAFIDQNTVCVQNPLKFDRLYF